MRLPWFTRKQEVRSFTVVRSDGAGSPMFRGPLVAPYNEDQARVNSVIAACLRYSLDNVIEPPLVVEENTSEGWKQVESFGWAALMGAPAGKANQDLAISEARLKQMVARSLNLDGNAYVFILRGDSGGFVGLMPLLHTDVAPQFSTDRRTITGYKIGGKIEPPDNVIHFRRGVDPTYPMMGESPLKAVMRQVLTDNEIAAYQHRIVQSPAPGVAIIVDGNLSEDEREALIASANSRFGGEKRGQPFVAGGDVKIESVGWSPAEMDIGNLARLPEERITAAFGIPPMTIGIGAGLERSTFDNMRTSMYSAVINHLDPLWTEIEQTLTMRLLPLVDSKPNRRVKFDRSQVMALQEDTNSLYSRVTDLFKANVIDRQKALMMLGEAYTSEDVGIYSWMLSPQAQILPQQEGRSMRQRLSNPLGL